MSRTEQSGTAASPVQKYLSFKGSTGQLRYYDKNSEDEDDKNVYLDSIEFVVLDVKSSISGFNENESCGISSNLLDRFDLGKKEFVVKTKVGGKFGEFTKGIYKDIKDKVFNIGGKFTTCIFALADVGNGLEIVRIDLSGASLGPWIEFESNLEGSDIYGQKITISKGKLCGRKDGKNYDVSKAEYNKVLEKAKKDPMAARPVWFYVSAVASVDITKEDVELAEAADKNLQAYFKSGIEESPAVAEEQANVASSQNEVDDLPF